MYASAFLKQFVPSGVNWIHLDVANVAWGTSISPDINGRGASGFGTRTLVNLTLNNSIYKKL